MTVLAQEYLPGRVGTASGMTIGLAVTLGGVVAPLLGRLADLLTGSGPPSRRSC